MSQFGPEHAMSECKNAAPNVTQPARASNALRRAWMWVAAYVAVEVCFYIYFEWHNAIFDTEDEYPLFRGIALFFFLGASLYLFIKSLVRRRKAAALLYVALFAMNLYWPRIGTALDLTAKAYFFSAFPDMCPEGAPKPGYRVFLCYKYWLMDSRTALVLNPGDELAAHYTSWPPEFDKELFRNSEIVVDECEKKHIRLLVNHVYLLEDLPQC
jgi:hypothetical protein